MFNTKKHKALIAVVIGFMVVGLVMTYVPLLFPPPQAYKLPKEESRTETPETATLLDTVAGDESSSDSDKTAESIQSPPAVASEPTSTVPDLQGFGGLEQEKKSLDELEKLLREPE